MATPGCEELEIETSSGPSYPLAQEQPDIETVDEEDYGFDALCLHPCFDSDDDSDGEANKPFDSKKTTETPCTPDGVACAWVLPEALWTDCDVLMVFFLNAVPKDWKYNGKPITPKDIVEWASDAWKSPGIKPEEREDKDPIPQFETTTRADRADIRVKFSCKKTCWSMLGSRAKEVDNETKPTMVLNLGFKKSKSSGKIIRGIDHDQRVKSLVIHEFGHALGLGHEHQRSDFWEVMEKHLNLKRMKDDDRVGKAIKKAGAASCGADWFEKPGGLLKAVHAVFGIKRKEASDSQQEGTDGGSADPTQADHVSEYDSTSIMHYGFDREWIKEPKYRVVRELMKIPDETLPAKEKKYLKGVIETNGKLAVKPSLTDIQALAKAYPAK